MIKYAISTRDTPPGENQTRPNGSRLGENQERMEMNMKKLLTMLMALMMVLALAACGNDTPAANAHVT